MNCETIRTDFHVEPTAAHVQRHLEACAQCRAYAARFARLDNVLRAELIVAPPAVLADTLAMIAAPAPSSERLAAAVRNEVIRPAPAVLTERLLALVPEPSRVTSPLDVALKRELVIEAPPEVSMRLQALVPQMSAEVKAAAPVARPRRRIVATVYFLTAAALLVSLMFAGDLYATMIHQLGLEQWFAQLAGMPAELLNRLYAIVPQARIVIGALVQLQQPLQWLLVGLLLWAIIDMTQHQRHTQQTT